MTASQSESVSPGVAALFRPFRVKGLRLPNRIVMAPMTRSSSPGGVPGPEVAAYYRRRAEGGVGLIVTEGTYVPHPSAGFDPNVPHLYDQQSLEGWRRVVEEVHAAGGKIIPQLWHVGTLVQPHERAGAGIRPMGPSGLARSGQQTDEPMSGPDIEDVVTAFGKAAEAAVDLGFDGLEIHGAHGYLIDQFFWSATNRRTDCYGGDLVARTRFAADIIKEIRRRVGPDFPIVLRYSQWKLQDYSSKLAGAPDELGRFLQPLTDAGVDVFHCSTRRFWEPEFAGSPLNLAGWTKRLTGKPTITVGSVTLNDDFVKSFASPEASKPSGLDELVDRLERGEFDLVAVGRSLIVNPSWPEHVRSGRLAELRPFQRDALKSLD
jgi:2,4-dienoyl-CoA reductase-like NADH-dependent reductase (Old Yellow Enzyme family)